MSLVQADWHEISQVLRETYRIWSPGLNRHDYHERVMSQMRHPWGRKHYRFVVHKVNDRIVSSCKLYDVSMAARGREYRALGIGAVYTMEEHRGRGHATRMLEQVIAQAEDDGYDAALLYSEIEPEFYEHLGFEEMGSAEFSIQTKSISDFAGSSKTSADGGGKTAVNAGRPIELVDIAWLERHHKRWLRTQPYGVARDATYWNYKIKSERFLREKSRLTWPALELIADCQFDDSGYLLLEQSATTLRILEVVASQSCSMRLLRSACERAVRSGAEKIRGWECVIQVLEPGYSLRGVFPQMTDGAFEAIRYGQRDWGIPMMLPLTDELDDWRREFPCPLLELDHF